MLRYKLTNENMETYNNTKWGEGISHETNGKGELCGPGWIHVYTSPLLAILLNPIHADFENPILWEVDCQGQSKTEKGLKEGWTKVTTIKQIPIPQITKEQKIAFGILCAKEICQETNWNKWADNWLNNTNRSYTAAAYAAVDAVDAAAYAAAYAVDAAAAADAADAAVDATAYAAAYAAAAAAVADAKIDLITIAEKAMQY